MCYHFSTKQSVLVSESSSRSNSFSACFSNAFSRKIIIVLEFPFMTPAAEGNSFSIDLICGSLVLILSNYVGIFLGN